MVKPKDLAEAQQKVGIAATIAGNRIEVIEEGKARLSAILDLIGSAKDSIRMLFYIFNNDSAGNQVRDALVEAVKRGVTVHLLLDGYGCSATKDEFFQELEDAGGDFCMFHPSYGRRYLLRNHQKLAIADGERALIGGSNIHDHYMRPADEDHWRDLWFHLDGPVVEHAADYFDALYRWTTSKRPKLRSLRRLIHRFSQSRGPLQWKFSGPISRRNPWPTSFARDVSKAGNLDMVAAYFSPPRSLLRRLRKVGRSGSARVITASKSDNNATIAAARHTYSRLLRSGVEMYEYQPARLHTKLIIADDVVHVGSANMDFRSIYLNLEIMLRIEDSGFAAAMRGYFERELKDCERITAELHRRRATPLRRAKWLISHWLVTTMDYTLTRRLNFAIE